MCYSEGEQQVHDFSSSGQVVGFGNVQSAMSFSSGLFLLIETRIRFKSK